MSQSVLSRRSRMLGGLWGSVVGDALGVPVEFTTRAERDRDPVREVRGYGTYNQPPGTWSDDSSLLLCTLLSLTEHEFSLQDLGQRFVRYLTESYLTPHGSVFDVGMATARAIDRLRAGTPPEEAGGTSERDNGNGSLMRILPVALRFYLEPPEQLVTRAHLASRLTHGHRRSQLACGYACLLLGRLLHGDSASAAYENTNAQVKRVYGAAEWQPELPHFRRLLSGRIAGEPRSAIHSSGYVIHTLEASVYLLLRCDSYAQAVLDAINLGDDTDTTACVVGGMLGVRYGQESIPTEWLTPLARRDELSRWFAAFVTRTLGSDS
jgi:ADP-ribosylglycohydrolase